MNDRRRVVEGTPRSAVERVHAAYRRIEEVGRPEVWISLRNDNEALAEAARVDERARAGESQKLAGLVVAVKDNIDAVGFATTCAFPPSARTPSEDATAVRLLREQGAIVLGKTNMDQFATGLVGTRSPFGAVPSAHDELLISGGSSSGSAVAVALGIVDFALGTDTAGSGRVPAALNGIVGIKGTLGLVSVRGVVPAAPSYDAVTVFARTLGEAELAMSVIAQPDTRDPASRRWPLDAPLAAPAEPRVAIPKAKNLTSMHPAWRAGFAASVERARQLGWVLTVIDITDLLDAAKVLYDGALVAERTASYRHLIDPLHPDADPSVAKIVLGGETITATELVRDQQKLREHRRNAQDLWSRFDAVMLPTAPGHPSLAEVAREPLKVNSWVGTFTNFVNLLDMAAVAVPAEGTDQGLTLVGPAFHDRVLLDLAAAIAPTVSGREHAAMWVPPATGLVVFGAHLRGQPLNHELSHRHARFLRTVATSPSYALFALRTQPEKPGIVRVAHGGSSIEGELWALPPGELAPLLDGIPAPMTVGRIELSDGTHELGFQCEPIALEGAADITDFGGWARYRQKPRVAVF